MQQFSVLLISVVLVKTKTICDRTWEKGPLRALLQNRVIGIQG